MSKYYKYVTEQCFTQDGANYVGGIIVSNKSAKDLSGNPLVYSNTYLGELYLGEKNIDVTYKNIEDLQPLNVKPFDLLDSTEFSKILDKLHDNNLICLKNLLVKNPKLISYDPDNFFYGISDDSNYSPSEIKKHYTYTDILPFSEFPEWSFLDNVTCGDFVIGENEKFLYICSDGNALYILSGGFGESENLKLISKIDNDPYYDKIHHIKHDIYENVLYIVKNDYIEIYDTVKLTDCLNLILIDKISLIATNTEEFIWSTVNKQWSNFLSLFSTRFTTSNQNNPQFIKFGKKLRTFYDTSTKILTLYNKNSSEVIYQLNMSDHISNLLSIDICGVTDDIILLDSEGLTHIDSTNFLISPKKKLLSKYSNTDSVEFSDYDSNDFFIWGEKEFQSRYITNPTYPSSRLERQNLNYLNNYIWSSTTELFKFLNSRWGANNKKSNSYNTLTCKVKTKNSKMYCLLHNIGRIYAIRQPYVERYISPYDLSMAKVDTSYTFSDSSIGLDINCKIDLILKELSYILGYIGKTFSIGEYNIIQKQIEDTTEDAKNFYIDSNETINSSVLMRILNSIENIQRSLLPAT